MDEGKLRVGQASGLPASCWRRERFWQATWQWSESGQAAGLCPPPPPWSFPPPPSGGVQGAKYSFILKGATSPRLGFPCHLPLGRQCLRHRPQRAFPNMALCTPK